MHLGRLAAFAAVVILLSPQPLSANARSFVASSGTDMNPCTRDLPCRSFAAAIAVTNPNGEVVAIDSAGYGPFTVSQPVAVIGSPGAHAAISVSSGNGVTVNAGSSDVVVLRNLYLTWQGVSSPGNGIALLSAGALHIENCVVSGFPTYDIELVPSVSAVVDVSDSVTRGSAGVGIFADSAGTLAVSIIRCRFENNSQGVLVSRALVAIRDSNADNNNVGFFAGGTSGQSAMSIEASIVSNASNAGIGVGGTGTVTVHNTTVLHATYAYYAYAPVGGTSKLSVDGCVSAASTNGVYAGTGGDVSVANSTIADTTNAGVVAFDGGVVRLTHNTITRNAIGIQNLSTIHSTGDNMVDGNGMDNTGAAITPATKM